MIPDNIIMPSPGNCLILKDNKDGAYTELKFNSESKAFVRRMSSETYLKNIKQDKIYLLNNLFILKIQNGIVYLFPEDVKDKIATEYNLLTDLPDEEYELENWRFVLSGEDRQVIKEKEKLTYSDQLETEDDHIATVAKLVIEEALLLEDSSINKDSLSNILTELGEEDADSEYLFSEALSIINKNIYITT